MSTQKKDNFGNTKNEGGIIRYWVLSHRPSQERATTTATTTEILQQPANPLPFPLPSFMSDKTSKKQGIPRAAFILPSTHPVVFAIAEYLITVPDLAVLGGIVVVCGIKKSWKQIRLVPGKRARWMGTPNQGDGGERLCPSRKLNRHWCMGVCVVQRAVKCRGCLLAPLH
jgi:hypothetical protein